ncbi:MAG: hypothetical protein QOG79_6829 [Mycobacterium sp.]|nr:hypothetical protein [Mycobacterium sp.]
MGTSFSMPITVINVRGRVRHIRLFPSDSTTASVPVSATPKLAPLTADPPRKELAPQMLPCGHREDPRLVGQFTDVGHFTHEDVSDFRSVAVYRGHQDMAGPVVAELDDQLGEVGLDRGDALGLEVLVEADLLGSHRLDLHHFLCASGPNQVGDDAVGLVGVARPMHHATARGDVSLELLKQLGQPGHHILLKRTAREAQLLPVGAFTHRG